MLSRVLQKARSSTEEQLLHRTHCSIRLLTLYLAQLFLTGAIAEAVIVLSVTPESRNVSEGKMVEFTCATPDSGVTLSWSTKPTVGATAKIDTDLPGGGKQSVLSFTAAAQHNNTNVTCIAAIFPSSLKHSTALLLVQGLLSPVGDLNSTEVDSCTLNFTWTAPYTLQGVPINYYNITINNITGHSDGAVLGSYTTNTTEYRYCVSRLGDSLEVVVAAVNDVGTGNTSAVVTELLPAFPIICNNVERSSNDWTYTFHVKGNCNRVLLGIVIKKCSDINNCKNTSGNVDMLPDGGRRVVATFTNLTENRIYSFSALVQYDRGVLYHSKLVDAGTFDVRSITKPLVEYGQVCFNISYVKGHEIHRSFAKLTCGTLEYTQMITGTSGCINSVLPHESCNLTVTDGDDDAVHNINTTAPVTITGISVPSYTVAPSTTSTTPTATPTTAPSDSPTGISDSPSTIPIPVLIAVSIGGVLPVLVIIIIIVVVGIFYLYKRNRVDSEMKPQPEQLSKNPTPGNWATTEEEQNAKSATHTQESSYAPSSKQPPADYPPPTKPPNIVYDEAATSTQQECDYAVVGATRPSDRPHQPPPADTRVVYSDISAVSFSTAC